MFQQTNSGVTTLCDKVCQLFEAGRLFSDAILSVRASKRNFAWRNKTALGPRGQTETSLKIEDLRSNKTTGSLPDYKINVADDQQPEFRSLSECYIVIFLNKLKIVENTPKMKKSKYHRPLLGSSCPGSMYRLNPSLIDPAHR